MMSGSLPVSLSIYRPLLSYPLLSSVLSPVITQTLPSLPPSSVPTARLAHEATLLNGSAKRDGRFAAEGVREEEGGKEGGRRRVTLQNYPGFRVELPIREGGRKEGGMEHDDQLN